MYEQLNEKKNRCARANSICPTPESVLLKLVLDNEREKIVRLVKDNTDLLMHIYYPEYNKPILLIACSKETVEAETIKTLIDLGADLYYSNEINEEWEAIHFAACSTRSDALRIIIQNIKKPGGVNAIAKGNNALHILIKYGHWREKPEEFVKCAKILVQEGINVNPGDNIGDSPILLAAERRYKDIIKVIIEDSGVPVDIDSHQSRKKTAREIILKEKLYDGPLPKKFDNNNDNDQTILFKYLRSENESAFVNFKNGDIGKELANSDDTSATLLQTSCNKNLKLATAHLLSQGADPNKTTPKNRKAPIVIAAENGSYEILQILLDNQNPKTEIPKTILILVLKYIDQEKYVKCYDILLNKLKNDKSLLDLDPVNATDEAKSPLHYAVRYAESDKVEELLQLGASLGCKNKYGVMPIRDIEPALLKKHLDSCIQFDSKCRKLDEEDFPVTFNYRTLIPPSKNVAYNVAYESDDPETNLNRNATRELVAETEVISYMSEAPEFKHLLKHPVITSFLFMKWHRIRWLFYINLIFYITFFLSLVLYIFTWYVNFSEGKSPVDKFITYASWLVLLVTFLILVFRELFQIAFSHKKYLNNFENYVEIILISVAGSILFIADPSEDTRRILSSVAILLAAFELVLMVGQHPQLSTNVVMLKTVSFNFFKFLLWYSLLIIAFALSFYILFTDPDSEVVMAPKKKEIDDRNKTSINSTKAEEDEEEVDFFSDPGNSVFKTIIMLTGEFDAGSMKFGHFPFTSSIIFSFFIFMIAIILLNLLNGLAISDTQLIKNDAELIGHIARAQHIRYVESMILENISSNLLEKLNSFCCCLPISRKQLAQRVFLFPHYLNEYELKVYPNKGGLICLPSLPSSKKKFPFGIYCMGSCLYVCLDGETVNRTNNIMREKRNENSYLQKVDGIIKDLETTNKKLDDIIKYISREQEA